MIKPRHRCPRNESLIRRRISASVAALVLLGPLMVAIQAVPPAHAAGTVLVGDNAVEPSVDNTGGGVAEAFTYTATASGQVTDLMVWVDKSSSAATFAVGFYADSGTGHPGALLTQGSLGQTTASAWNDFPVPPAQVTAGAQYWIAFLGPGGNGNPAWRDRCCGGGPALAESSAQSNLNGFPSTWSTGTVYQDGPASAYALQAAPPPPPSAMGQWSALATWPIVPVHTTLLNTGNILTWDAWATPTLAKVYDPAANTFTDVTNASDIFCSGVVTLADGRVLVAGGHVPGPDGGMAQTNIFDPRTSTWTRGPDMHSQRWYPSVVQLADGRVLTMSGEVNVGVYSDTPEIYDPGKNTWTSLTSISTSQVHELEYPRSNLLPNGNVFVLAASTGQSFILNPLAPSWTKLATTSSVNNGSAVMYRPGKVLYTGGGNVASTSNPSLKVAQTIDLTAAAPQWSNAAPMAFGRYEHNLVMLPDGNVLAVEGASVMSQDPSVAGALPAEIWNPTTGVWTTLSSMAVPRGYHSTAVLMPDGRVLVGGGGKAVGSPTDPGNYNAQFYSPPYLFKGARPTITSGPTSMTYGGSAFVQTPDAASIASVSLVDLATGTHATDMDQHFVPLSFTQASGGINVTAPASAALAPPGTYMLFVVNSNGVPSVAPFVRMTPQPPAVVVTAPATGASVSGTAVAVAATVTDGTPVTGAQLLVDGSPVGPVVTAAPYTFSWDSTLVGNGSHTLSVQATDAAGAIGTSTPVTVTVANPPPVISGGSVTTLTSTSATLSWTTDKPADSQIVYGTSTNYVSSTALDPTKVTSHAQTLSGLKSGTVYHCSLHSTNGGGTAASPDIAFTTTTGPPPLAVDVFVSRDGTGTVATAPFTTTSPGEVLIALVASDGVGTQTVKVTGAGLTWTLVQRSNAWGGDAEIWTARATSVLTNATVTSTPGLGGYDQTISVLAATGATGVGASANANAGSGTQTVSLTASATGSLVVGVGADYDAYSARTPAPDQTITHQWVDPGAGTFWTQQVNAPVSAAGQVVTLSDTAPTQGRWNMGAVEIRQ